MRHVGVVGGSVAGLTIAALIYKTEEKRQTEAEAAGCVYEPLWSVSVYEQATDLRGGGAGVGITDSAKEILDSICGPEAFSMLPMRRKENRAFDGAEESLIHNGDHPYWAMYWNDIYAGLLAYLPNSVVCFSKKFAGMEAADDGGVRLRFADGSLSGHCDMVVGSDGAGSSVRGLMMEKEPREDLIYRGYCGWRGVLDVSPGSPFAGLGHQLRADYPLLGNCLYFLMAPGQHTVLYELPGGLMNWLIYADAPIARCKGGFTKRPSEEERREFAKRARCMHIASLANVIEATDGPLMNDIYDMEPMEEENWFSGVCVLAGDAAHPTSPHRGMGSNMAVEDAFVLVGEMYKDDGEEVRDIACRYAALRQPATSEVVLHSRALGILKNSIVGPDGGIHWDEAQGCTVERGWLVDRRQ